MKAAILILTTVLLSAPKSCNKGMFNDKCPLSYKVEWQIVEQGVDVEKQIDLLAKLSAAAKADADKISDVIGSGEANADLETKFELSKVVQSNEIKKASVSQDVFDEYVRIRASSCNIWDGIKGGIYGDNDEALNKARELFTTIQERFSDLEKKKKL